MEKPSFVPVVFAGVFAMNFPPDFELQIWKEVSRHAEIQEFATKAWLILCEANSLAELSIRWLEESHCTLAPIAFASDCASQNSWRTVVIDKAATKLMKRWCLGTAPCANDVESLSLRSLLFADGATNAFAIPLGQHDNGFGILNLKWNESSVSRHHVHEVNALLREPFAVALGNHRRIHELATLREAAEAERGALLRRLGRQTGTDDSIVGESTGLKGVMERVQSVAKLAVPILVLGETGTGKEVIARALHQRSERASGPFIRVNCGAIPTELIDSQLFGHEKGSFTGAESSHSGWFERADGGTLFLDEIGELPLEAQVRLLRVLQDGNIERVGAKQSIHVDVRLVAATHRDLLAMVREGRFREDLWYRVAVFPIRLPTLRERIADIGLLARHFAERAALRFGLPLVEPSETDVKMLQAYDWPGNIRELGAVMDRAAILGDGRELAIDKALGLGSQVHAPILIQHERQSKSVELDSSEWSLEAVTKRHIELALKKSHGKIEGRGGAAHLLEINPHTLRARMRKLKITWRNFRD